MGRMNAGGENPSCKDAAEQLWAAVKALSRPLVANENTLRRSYHHELIFQTSAVPFFLFCEFSLVLPGDAEES